MSHRLSFFFFFIDDYNIKAFYGRHKTMVNQGLKQIWLINANPITG